MTTEGAEWFRICARCEEPLPLGVQHPVYTEETGGGLTLYAFCDADCMHRWVDRRSDEG